ncbi:hypothetical protein BJ165DRAFT_1194107 [Panaeolus papilionaceus]|nr:hypothetical protein BJ165DRAFT_1194107 [Panaeolus papilionaceus]
MEEFLAQCCTNRRIPWPHNEWSRAPLSFPSSFAHLLNHNHPPSPVEVSRVKRFRESIQLDLLQQNKEQIKRLQEELDRLKSVQTGLEKQVFACDVILSPFRRLPLDVIHEIIEQSPTVHPSDASSSPKTHLPSILAQTSRVWRQAVFSTSRLWQDLHFTFEDWGTGADYIMHRLELFSQLSRSLPLSLRLDKRVFTDETYDWNQVSFLQWLLSIWKNRERMTRVCLTGVDPAIVAQQWQVGVDALPNHPTPSVKSVLFLEEDRVYGEGLESKTVTKLLDLLPRLEHIWLGCRISELGTISRLPAASLQSWSRLKTLYMGTSFSALNWRALLQTCPNLEAAFVHIHHEPAQYDLAPPSAIVHNRLKELLIRFTVYNHSILAPFCGLSLPNVHTLELTFIHSKLYLTLPHHLERQLSSTFPSLKSLSIHRTSDIENSIECIFPLFLTFGSTITTLRISLSFRNVCQTLPFLCGWTSGSRTRPLPLLEHLTLDFSPQPMHWNDNLPNQLTPLFMNVRKSLGTPTEPIWSEWHSSSQDPSPPPNLQSMTICLNTPPRPNLTKTTRKIIRFFNGLQKKYNTERAGIQVKVEESCDETFEPYERRFMDRFEV